MFEWFEKEAPIRTKFKALLAVHTILGVVGLATTLLAVGGVLSGFVLVAIAALALAAIVATVLLSAKLICTPYVNTVLRMEGLAHGDIASEILYTDYNDCVGRMTKAMATFRDNAVEVQKNREAQQVVVESLGSALKTLSRNELTCQIRRTFPESYEELRKDFNQAVDSLAAAISAVRHSAASVLNGAQEIHIASNDLSQRNEQ